MKITSAPRIGLAWCGVILGALGPLLVSEIRAQPATWTSTDVGAVGAAGSASESGGILTVRGAGEDVWGANDEFHYYHRAWTGDGVFTVRVTAVQNTFNWAKAGLMLRSDLTSNAQHAYAFVSPEQNTSLVYRTSTGGSTTSPGPVDFRQKAMPMWLKLTRVGDQIAMDYSFDGANWLRRSTTTVAFPANVRLGLAVNSHVDATLCTATFDNLILDTVRPTQATVIARAPTRVQVRWQDNDLDETGFEIERSTDNVNFARVGTAPAWNIPAWSAFMQPVVPPSFTDETANAATTYYYRVRSITPRGASEFSNSIAVTTPPAPPAGWSYADIGDTGATGRTTLAGGTFTVSGAGAGVGGVTYHRESTTRGDFGTHVPGFSDEMQFAWRPWSGEGEIIARVSGVSGATTGHAGVMVRVAGGAPDASAFNVFAHVKVAGGLGVMARPGTYAQFYEPSNYRRETFTNYYSSTVETPPVWLRVVRLSEGVISYRSADGINWTYLGWVKTPLVNDLQFGLAVSSQNDGAPPAASAVLSANFGNVSVGAISVPVPAPQPPTDAQATSVQQGGMMLEWTNPPELYDGVDVQMSTDGTAFSPLGSTTTGRISVGLLRENTDYFFRFGTRRGSTVSAFSPVLRVRTQAFPAAPTQLAATAVSTTQINLTWTDHANNEEGFIVERSTDNTNFVWAQWASANATGASITGLSPSTTYYFRVHASPEGAPIAYSNVASANTLDPTSPTPPAAPSNLAATALSPTSVNLTWTDNANNESGFQLQRSTDNATFTTIATFPANTQQAADNAASGATTYYYRVRASNFDATPSAYSNVAPVTTPVTPPTGNSWQSGDIGAVGAGGSDSESGGVVTINASGADIWNSADEFRFRYQAWSGDGVITARVVDISGTHNWAKAGVMFRESAAANARHAFMSVAHTSGVSLQFRTAVGGESANEAIAPGLPPRWVRLIRAGNTFSGYESQNGTDWTPRGTITIAGLGNEILVGLAATSHNDGAVCTVHFDNVSVSGPATSGPLAAPGNLAATAVTGNRVDLSWSDNSPDETGFALERSADNTTFTPLTTFGSNVTSHVDTTVSPTTTYYYRVRAQRGGTLSSFSNVASATTPGASPPPGAPTSLVANAVSNQRVELVWTDHASDETSFQIERGTDGVSFANIGGTGPNNTQFADTNVTAGVTYHYRVRARRNEAASAFSNVATATPSSAPPSGGWQSQDIGAVAATGSSSGSGGGAVTVNASGADIWNTADEFHFRYQAWTGDGEIITRVTTLTNTHGWTKAGVMFRETLNPNARHATMFVSSAHGTAFQFRNSTGGESGSSPPSESGGVPRWLKVVRSGDTFTGFASLDGTTWSEAGSVTIGAAAATFYVGVALTSHDDGALATATFETIDLHALGGPPPTGVNAPSALSATALSSTQIALNWTDNSANETAFQVERSTDNASFALLASFAPNTTSVTDDTVAAGTTYFYRVRAVAGSAVSAYSNVASTASAGAWSQADIGAVGRAGSNDTPSVNSIRINASGADVWDSADAFRFVYRTVSGDCVVEANVSSLTNTHPWAKAGVMIRESADANARNIFVFLTPANGVSAQVRSGTGSPTNAIAGPWWPSAPYWVRLTRAGNRFTAFSSADGVTWTQFATFEGPFAATAHVGFAVTSHDNSQLATAVFVDPFIR